MGECGFGIFTSPTTQTNDERLSQYINELFQPAIAAPPGPESAEAGRVTVASAENIKCHVMSACCGRAARHVAVEALNYHHHVH